MGGGRRERGGEGGAVLPAQHPLSGNGHWVDLEDWQMGEPVTACTDTKKECQVLLLSVLCYD